MYNSYNVTIHNNDIQEYKRLFKNIFFIYIAQAYLANSLVVDMMLESRYFTLINRIHKSNTILAYIQVRRGSEPLILVTNTYTNKKGN